MTYLLGINNFKFGIHFSGGCDLISFLWVNKKKLNSPIRITVFKNTLLTKLTTDRKKERGTGHKLFK